MTHETVIRALRMAAPLAIAARYDTGLNRCVEASVCGAKVLTIHGFDADPLPCAIVARNDARCAVGTVGLEARDCYSLIEDPGCSFEEWQRESGVYLTSSPDGGPMTHMVIRSRSDREVAIVDLTVGQIRKELGIDAPATDHWIGDSWCTVSTPDGWRVGYMSHPRPNEVMSVAAGTWSDGHGMVDDLANLTDLALQCELDHSLMLMAMQRSQPDVYAVATSRLARFLALPCSSP